MLICKTGCGFSVGKMPGMLLHALRTSAATFSISARSFASFKKQHGENAGTQPGAAGDGEIFIDRRIGLQNRIELVLELALLLGRCAFLDDERTRE